MKKRVVTIIGAAVLIFALTITALAAPAVGRRNMAGNGKEGTGVCVVTDYCPMVDEDGNLLDRETFETNLDKAISDGLINESDRDYYLERYDFCTTYSSGTMGNCGGGKRGGCGRRMNYTAP